MQLKALTRSAKKMTGDQCRLSDEMGGLKGGRELTTTRVEKQGNTGWSWMHGWTGEVPVMVSSRDSVSLCLGGRLTPETANAWWWTRESATESWRRDLQEFGLFIVFGADGQHDYFYPRRILHREGAGRSWAIETPQIPLGWSENKARNNTE